MRRKGGERRPTKSENQDGQGQEQGQAPAVSSAPPAPQQEGEEAKRDITYLMKVVEENETDLEEVKAWFHVTEPVALVAAPTRDRALEAAKHVRLRCTPLPALLDPEVAEGNDLVVYGPDNVFDRIDLQHGDLDAGFAEADLVVEGTYRVGLQEQRPDIFKFSIDSCLEELVETCGSTGSISAGVRQVTLLRRS